MLNLRIICCFFFGFSAFSTKNFEIAYFNQGMECPATKCWSKYTTAFIMAAMELFHENKLLEVLGQKPLKLKINTRSQQVNFVLKLETNLKKLGKQGPIFELLQ